MTERQNYQGPELYSPEERVEQARRAMVSFAESIQALAEANKSLLEDREQSFGCGVVGTLTAHPAFHVLECTAQFFDTERTTLYFKGFRISSGFVISEGRFRGAANFSVPPSELVDSWMDFSVKMTEISGTPPRKGGLSGLSGAHRVTNWLAHILATALPALILQLMALVSGQDSPDSS